MPDDHEREMIRRLLTEGVEGLEDFEKVFLETVCDSGEPLSESGRDMLDRIYTRQFAE